MRKRVTVILIFFTVAIGVFAWQFYEKRKETVLAVPYRALLDEKPIWFTELFDGAKYWQSFKKSNFYKEIPKNYFVKRLMETPQFQRLKASFSEFEKEVGFPFTEQTLLSLFGQDIAIAVLPPKRSQDAEEKRIDGNTQRTEQISITPPPLPRFALFLRIGANANLSSLAMKISKLFGGKNSYQMHRYGKHDVYEFSTGNFLYPTVLSTVIADTIIVASQVQILEGIFARLKKHTISEELPMRDLPGKSLFYSYFNNKLYQDLLIGFKGKKGCKEIENRWLKLSVGMGEEVYFYGIWKGGLVLEGKSSMGNTASVLKSIVCTTPTEQATLSYISQNCVFYWWTNIFDLSKFHKMISQFALSDPKIEKVYGVFLRNLEQKYGIDINRLFSSLGPQCSLVLFSPASDSSFNLPGIGIFVETRDRDFVEKTITNLARRPDRQNSTLNLAFSWKENKHGNYTIKYFQTPLGLTPGYLFLDSFLVGGVKINDFESMIDLAKGGPEKSLKTYPLFKNVVLEGQANNIVYVNFSALLRLLEDVIRQFPILRAKWTEDDERTFYALMRIVSVVRGIGMTTKWQDPWITFHHKIYFKDFAPISKLKGKVTPGRN